MPVDILEMTSVPIECSDITFYISSPEDGVSSGNNFTNTIPEIHGIERTDQTSSFLKHNDSSAECHSIENYSESENEVISNILNESKEKGTMTDLKIDEKNENGDVGKEKKEENRNGSIDSGCRKDISGNDFECQCDGQTLSPCKALHSSNKSSRVHFKDLNEDENSNSESHVKYNKNSFNGNSATFSNGNVHHRHLDSNNCSANLENGKHDLLQSGVKSSKEEEFSITNIQRLSRNSRYRKRNQREVIPVEETEKTSWWKEFSVTHIKVRTV